MFGEEGKWGAKERKAAPCQGTDPIESALDKHSWNGQCTCLGWTDTASPGAPVGARLLWEQTLPLQRCLTPNMFTTVTPACRQAWQRAALRVPATKVGSQLQMDDCPQTGTFTQEPPPPGDTVSHGFTTECVGAPVSGQKAWGPPGEGGWRTVWPE